MSDEKDLASMSDEDFLNESLALEGSSTQTEEDVPEPEPQGGILEDRLRAPLDETDPEDDEATGSNDPTPPAPEGKTDTDEDEPEEQIEDGGTPPAGSDPEGESESSDSDHTTPKQTAPSEKENGTPAEETDATPTEEIDYKALYEKLMAPFKANGKEFAVESPDEAVRLMQMGANYTKKMQALKPNLRMMRMLENNGLLNEEKLSFLIDLDQKNPQAIQKLLKDGNVDPLEIDTSEEPAYQPSNHTVSDEEMAFHDAITDVSTSSGGKETIAHINTEWDQASKQVIYQEPTVLKVINDQRANGIYDQISAEIDRQRTLGQLTDTPFIHAYKIVGDRLQSEGKLRPIGASPQGNNPAPAAQQPQVLESRAEPSSRKRVSNGDKAKAAASSPKAAQSNKPRSFDPFQMSDEEILAIPDPKF